MGEENEEDALRECFLRPQRPRLAMMKTWILQGIEDACTEEVDER